MSEQQVETQMPADKSAKKSKKTKAPKGWIRWSGLVAFLVIAGLVVGLVYFVNSMGLKKIIETQASEAWGAKVEIGSVGFGINPIGLKLDRLQVTDPENTMSNLVELEKIRLTVNLYHAVVGRFVVEDMALTGLKMDQPRKRDGALSAETLARLAKEQAEKERKKAEEEPFEFPSIDLPSTDEILAREKLETVESSNQLEQKIASVQQEWAQIQKNLPTAEKLKTYEDQVNAALKTEIKSLKDLETVKENLEKVKKSWQADQKLVADAQQFLKQNQQQISANLAALPGLPDKDLQRLLATYSLDEQGLSNVSYLLFGAAAQEKIDLALEWYHKAEPAIEWLKKYQAEKQQKAALEPKKPRFKGLDVKFREFDPQPTFMVKRIAFDGEIEWGHLQAKVWDLNFDHKNSKKPVRFAALAKPETQQAGLVVEGTSSAVETDDWITQGSANWENYQLENWWMAQTDSLAINLASSNLQINTDFSLQNFAQLQTQIGLNYQQAQFDLSQSQSTDVKKHLAPVFADIDEFAVAIEIKGTPYAPRFDARSDLDAKISAGINKVMKQQIAAFEKELKGKLNQKMLELKQPIDQELAKIGLDAKALDDTDKLLKDLENQANSKVKEQENFLKNQVEAEKKKLEQELKAKQAAEQKKAEQAAKKKLEDQLKKKLPF